jgi:hypothetical protein
MESVKKSAKIVIGPLASRIDEVTAITIDGSTHGFDVYVTVFIPTYRNAIEKCSNLLEFVEGKPTSC